MMVSSLRVYLRKCTIDTSLLQQHSQGSISPVCHMLTVHRIDETLLSILYSIYVYFQIVAVRYIIGITG